jgi:hypothetical protein
VRAGKRLERRLRVEVPPRDASYGPGQNASVARMDADRVNGIGFRSFFAAKLSDEERFFDVEVADEAVGRSGEDFGARFVPCLKTVNI